MAIRLIYFQNEAGGPKVAVAELSPDIEQTAKEDQPDLYQQSLQIKNQQYRRQWLGTRMLLKNIEPGAGAVSYAATGKPFLAGSHLDLSISHTSNFCAISLNKENTGLDIEILGSKVERICDRFLSETEKEFATDSVRKHIIWGAKETIFKAWSHGNVEFKKDIQISPFEASDEGMIQATFKERDYRLRFKKLNHLMLVYLFD